ncbi:MAG: hypothetical protein ACYTFG_20915 [Planctomycetota bacterium]
METSSEPSKCRSCSEELKEDEYGEKSCANPDCPSNKRTKPICQECRVVMEEIDQAPGGMGYKCPKCGVVSQS